MTGEHGIVKIECEDLDMTGSQMRMPCSKCKQNHPARFQETSDKLSLLAQAFTPIQLPKRPDKVPLTEYQKQAIKDWVMPMATTSAKCDYCQGMYSSGYLKICPVRPEYFCGSKPWEPPPKRGYSDEELEFYFGWTRAELDDKGN